MTGRTIPHWQSAAQEICRQIESRRSPLKIILKTRNERHFLLKWIEHHAKIVDPKDLIIFDNESDDPDVFEIMYRNSSVNIFQYGGFHNNIHRPALFPALYDSLRASCDFYTFIDTDEFIIWADETGARLPPEKIVPALAGLGEAEIIIGAWVENILGHEDRFRLFNAGGRTPIGLSGGKSIISSRVAVEGLVCHNFQQRCAKVSVQNPANILLLHMKNMEAEQRIRVNIDKLKKYKFLKASEGIARVLAEDWAALPPGNVRQWIKEIQTMQAQAPAGTSAAGPLRPGQFILREDGTIQFHSEADRARYVAFLGAAGPAFGQMLASRDKAQDAPPRTPPETL